MKVDPRPGNPLPKVLIVVGALVAAWPVRSLLVPGGPGINGDIVVAHVSGMLAGYGAVVLVALMSRWPVIEQRVGVDQLARWHARGGRLVLALITTHACAAIVVWARVRGLDAWGAMTDGRTGQAATRAPSPISTFGRALPGPAATVMAAGREPGPCRAVRAVRRSPATWRAP